jgi:hypothetical protein
MGEAPAYSFAVVCEARADYETACGLADRMLCAEIEWISEELLDRYRRWRGLHENEQYLTWKELQQLKAKLGRPPRIFGHFGGEPGAPDAWAARLVLTLLAGRITPPPDAVLLVRDSDGDLQRRRGLNQARQSQSWPFKVVVALAHPKREAWVLLGFDARDSQESERLAALREELSFDPVQRSHKLDAREHGAKKDLKRILAQLMGGDPVREGDCLRITPLAVLEQRGAQSGLSSYLHEVRQHLIPIFTSSMQAPA